VTARAACIRCEQRQRRGGEARLAQLEGAADQVDGKAFDFGCPDFQNTAAMEKRARKAIKL